MNGIAVLVAGTLCFALAVSGCEGAPAGRAADPTPAATEPGETVQIPNPVSEAPSAASLAAMGVPLEAPFGAEQVTYSVIGDTVAQVQFTLNGVEYTFRGGQAEEEISGIYGTVTEEVCVAACGAYYSQETTYRTYADGGKLALWDFGGMGFTLYAARPDEAFDGIPDALGHYVANRLEEETWNSPFDPKDDPFAAKRPDAVLTVRDVTAGGLTYQIENQRADELTFGEDYALWKRVGDRWCAVPYCKPETTVCGVGFNDLGIVSAEPQTLDWTWLYGSLAPGDYRLVKSVSWGSGDRLEPAQVFADFTIEL